MCQAICGCAKCCTRWYHYYYSYVCQLTYAVLFRPMQCYNALKLLAQHDAGTSVMPCGVPTSTWVLPTQQRWVLLNME
jgi:hypothetical protein